jgi:phosphoribosyl 1,2-cyclic phosphodiesterase
VETPVLAFQTLASGSSGNVALVRSRRAVLALDLGIPARRTLVQRLAEAGVPPGHLTAALVSHEHSDHLGWAGLKWCIDAHVPVLAGRATLLAATHLHRAKAGTDVPGGLLQEIRAGATYLVEDVEVTPFAVPHDVPTFGYLLRSGSGSARRTLAVATDLGCARDDLVPYFADADALLLEANYDEGMLRGSPRHPLDKARVASDHGHLSNVQSGRFLQAVASASRTLPRAVVLAHLSRDHNTPDLAVGTVGREAAAVVRTVPVATAPAFDPGPWIAL